MSGLGGLHIGVKIVARNPCPEHGIVHMESDACQKGFVGENYKEYDMGLRGFSAMLIANVFKTATTADIKDTSNVSQTITANSAVTTCQLVAGAGVTAPVFSNYDVQSTGIAGDPTFDGNSPITATVNNTITDNSSNGTFTITGTFTNNYAGNETYGNIGIYITNSVSTFMMAHDQTNGGSGYVVSHLGTVAVTYTITVS